MDPAQTVQTIYDAFARGDYETILEHLDEHVRAHAEVPGSPVVTYEGRDGVRRLLADHFGPRLVGTQIEVQDTVVEDDGRVTARIRFAAGDEGAPVFNAMQIFQFRDALITEMWFQPMDEEAAQRFWNEVAGGEPPVT